MIGEKGNTPNPDEAGLSVDHPVFQGGRVGDITNTHLLSDLDKIRRGSDGVDPSPDFTDRAMDAIIDGTPPIQRHK